MATKSSKVSLSPALDALFSIAPNSNSSIFSPNSSATLLIDSSEVVVALGSSKNKLNTLLRSSVVSRSGILLFTVWQKSLNVAPPKFLLRGFGAAGVHSRVSTAHHKHAMCWIQRSVCRGVGCVHEVDACQVFV